jgi:ATP-binding cassette, subfamily F, member 3
VLPEAPFEKLEVEQDHHVAELARERVDERAAGVAARLREEAADRAFDARSVAPDDRLELAGVLRERLGDRGRIEQEVRAPLADREQAFGVHAELIGPPGRRFECACPLPTFRAVLLRLEGVGKGFGGRRLFGDVDLAIAPGDRIGLVGPNGAGKTTLLRIASGDDPADEGRVIVARERRVALLRQEIDPHVGRSAREEAGLAFADLSALENELRELETRIAGAGGEVPAALAERYDRAHEIFERRGGFEREARIARTLEGLGFDAARRETPLATLSGGWRMRVELAKLLLADPDVLLLDEPTNHLDLPSIQWFEETIQGFRGALVVVSHDRAFLERHVNRVAELTPFTFTVFEGNWAYYLAERELRREQLLARQRAEGRRVAEIERFIERFRYKSSKARQVQSRVKALAKREKIDALPETARKMRLKVPAAARAGAVVLRLSDVHKAYGENKVYEGIDVEIQRGERVALVGPNGAGKSTLLRILAGVLAPDRGTRELGHKAEVAFYAQHQLEALDPRRTVLEELGTVATLDDHARLRGHLGAFLFSGDDVEKKISVLSGGEKARVALAKMLLRPSNVLVLDEPTNHLDVDACEVLEGALADYTGTLAFISHDRRFIDALATRVLEITPGRLREFLGNYADYRTKVAAEAARAAVKAPAAPRPASLAPAASSAAPAPQAAAASREDRDRARERKKAREKLEKKLAGVEAEILEKEKAVEALAWQLGDPNVFRDPDRIRALESERETAQTEIAAGYREWERIAAELEALSDLA